MDGSEISVKADAEVAQLAKGFCVLSVITLFANRDTPAFLHGLGQGRDE